MTSPPRTPKRRARMTKKENPDAPVIIDSLALATDWDALPSLTKILTKGPPTEVRWHLDPMGRLLLGGNLLPPIMSTWLGKALIAIAGGADANEALHVAGNKQITVSQIAKEEYLVEALHRQGMSIDEAMGVVSRMDWGLWNADWRVRLRPRDKDGNDQRETLKKRLKRSRK